MVLDGLTPYKNDKVAQACDMVVTSLYTRNMLSTTLFPGYDNLVKPCHKLVSLYKVVTSCHKTLHKFETNCYKTCFFFSVVVVTRYLHVTCMLHFWQQACNMFPGQYRHATCTLCATCVLYVMCQPRTQALGRRGEKEPGIHCSRMRVIIPC